MTKYYINNQGDYIGAFDGSPPPENSIEVATPPERALDKFINDGWVLHNRTELRKAEIDSFLVGNEPLALIIEAIEDAQGLSRGQLVVDAKAKIT